MPVIESSYRAPMLLRNGHFNTIYPSLFRKLTADIREREVIETPDQDVLCLDWYRAPSEEEQQSTKTLVVVSHGLEGHSERPYVLGMCRQINRQGWDALAWNFRSCGPLMNKQKRFYHSGATEDLKRIIEHAHTEYDQIALVGFSMGGNLSLLHSGREAKELNPKTKAVVGLSVPCDLEGCAYELAKRQNVIYMKRFMKDLKAKMLHKKHQFPDLVVDNLESISNFQEFDDLYTAPLHGFADAKDYWQRSSCLGYLNNIEIPALIINAKDDPFLPETAYPYEIARSSKNLTLETPKHGGHVGFVSFRSNGSYWSEHRTMAFLHEHLC